VEKSFGKGPDHVSVITRIDGARVLGMTPDRTTESVDILWKTMSAKQRRKFRTVCMDMWQAYETRTEPYALDAEIVHDRFHSTTCRNEAVAEVRRRGQRELHEDGDDRLKGVGQILLFNPENLSHEQNVELAALGKNTLATGRAWSLKELFRSFWQAMRCGGEHSFIHVCMVHP